MNENQMKLIADSLVKASKIGTANALTYIQKGLEAYKMVEIPITNEYRKRIPYRDNKEVQSFIDFMLIYLDEAIKSLEKNKSGDINV